MEYNLIIGTKQIKNLSNLIILILFVVLHRETFTTSASSGCIWIDPLKSLPI